MVGTDKKSKKNSPIIRFFLIVLVITVLAGAVLLALNYKRLISGSKTTKQISFDINADNLYKWIDSGLVIVSGTGIQLITENGETLLADTAILQNPAVAQGKEIAAVWSIGNKDFYTVGNSKGAVLTSTDKEVINISVNSEGWTAVSAQESGYKGAVSVYNNKHKQVYKWSSGDGYLVNAIISDSSDKMASLTINETGSVLHFFSLGSTEQRGSYTAENSVLFDLAFLSNSSVCALSSNMAYFLNEKGSLISKYDFAGGYLKDYSLEGSGFAALFVGKYKAGNTGTIVTLSPTGTTLGKLDINNEVLSFSARGKYVAVLYTDTLVVYRSDMSVYAKLSDTGNIRQVIMRSDGSVVMLSNSGAAVYKP